MAIDLDRVRYLYRVKMNEHYGSMTAVSMKDAKSIYGSKAEYRKAKFEPMIASFVDHADQRVRAMAFNGATTMQEFEAAYPECKKNNPTWMLEE